MSGWLIYWITRLDAFSNIFISGIIIGGVCSMFGLIFHLVGKYDEELPHMNLPGILLLKIFVPILIICLLLNAFLPNTKEACAIYLIPKIANNEEVQKIPQNFLKLINTKFEEWLADNFEDAEGE